MKSAAATPSDEELMLAYGAGDEEALVILFQRYKLKIFNYFLRHLDDRAAAEDLLQSTFLKIHRARKSYRPTAAFSTWVFTIATNLQRDYKLSARRHPHVVELEEFRVKAARGGGFSEPVVLSDERTPEVGYGKNQIAEQIRRAVQSLPAEQKEVILLAKYQGLKYQEIAEILNITVSAAKVRAHRAMRALEKILKDRLGKLPF